MPTALFSHAECNLHDAGADHPECPARLAAISDRLLASGLQRLAVVTGHQAGAVRDALAGGADYVDPEQPPRCRCSTTS